MKPLSSLRESLNYIGSVVIERTPTPVLAVIFILVVVAAIGMAFQYLIAAVFGATIPATPLDTGFESETVAQPSIDLSDPQQDVLGWERGYWYTESISVNVSDGLTGKERRAMLGRTMARVEAIRKEEFTQMWVYTDDPILSVFDLYQKQPTSIELIPRSAITSGGETNVASLPFRDTVYGAAFLVGENASEPEVYTRITGNAQLASYSFSTNSIQIITGSSSQVTETVLAHELVHALQDQHNLLDGSPDTIDEKKVKQTRIEGPANAVSRLYEKRCGDEWECWGNDESESIAHRYEGRYHLLYFAYSEGTDFVSTLYRNGGWTAVNQLHRQSPTTTGQIIYNTYPKDQPVKISLNDTSSDNWKQLRPDTPLIPSWVPLVHLQDYETLGPAAVGTMFHRTTLDEYNRSSVVSANTTERYHYANQYVKGWEGDRIHVYRNEAGETGYVWKLAWESPKEAREFVKGYRRLLSHWGGKQMEDGRWLIQEGPFADAFSIQRHGDTVVIVNAPTISALSDLRPATSKSE
jgi:hypothetical protein